MDCLDLSTTVKPPATLGDVLRRLERHTDLAASRRRDLVSAVRAVARFAGTVPDAVPADVPPLREVLDGAQPGRFRMSRRRLDNIRSLFVQALILTGADVEPLRLEVALTSDWQCLRALLSPAERNLIARFCQHCSARGIAPAAVSDEVVAVYSENLVTRSLVKHPRKHVHNLIRSWNQAREREAAWPPVRLTPPVGREVVSRPLREFPIPFRADLQAWLDRLAGSDPLAAAPPSSDALRSWFTTAGIPRTSRACAPSSSSTPPRSSCAGTSPAAGTDRPGTPRPRRACCWRSRATGAGSTRRSSNRCGR
jgi:hypothetical protein